MKFKLSVLLILIFLIPSAMAQTTYFIKYKDYVSKTEIESKIATDSFLPPNTNFNLDAKVTSIDYLAKGLAKEDEILGRIIKINFFDSVDESQFIQLKNLDPSIEYVQKANVYQMDLVPNDSLLSEQWALQKIQAFDAWDVTTGSDTVLLAIIDTGIEFFHPDLKNQIYYNPGEEGEKSNNGIDDDGNGFVDDYMGWDFINWNNFPYDSVRGNFGYHGTFVAGIAGAEINNLSGIAGVAPNIKLLNLRSFTNAGQGEEDDAAAAIIYAVQAGAKVINMSFGDTTFSYVLRDVIRYAYSRNIVLVASAGNWSTNKTHYPSGYLEVISVSASTPADYYVPSFTWGSTIDLAAPGIDIWSTDMKGNYLKTGGTSASAPFVSATAALILSLQSFANEEVKQIIKSTTDDIGEPGWDDKSGAGRLNLYRALTTLAPSIIKYNHPYQDFATTDSILKINATVLSASFSSYSLYYGVGLDPEDWISLIQNGTQQFSNDSIYTLDLSTFQEGVYCLRLVVNLTNGRTLEERVNFYVIRTPPVVVEVAYGTAYLGNRSTIAGEFYTNQKCLMRMYYRIKDSGQNFNYVTLDGFNTNNQSFKQLHWGYIPEGIVQASTTYEVYFEAENLAGLKTTIVDSLNNNNYFQFQTEDLPQSASYNLMPFYLSNVSRFFYEPVSFLSGNNNEVLYQPFKEGNDVIFFDYTLVNNDFVKFESDSLKNRYPLLYGDFNDNGLKDLICINNTKNNNQLDNTQIVLLEQTQNGSFSFVEKDSATKLFYPILIDELLNDGNNYLITENGITIKRTPPAKDTTLYRYIIWKINQDLTTSIVDSTFFVGRKDAFGFHYPTRSMLVDDIDNDGVKEIWFLDSNGNLRSFKVNSINNITKSDSFYISNNPNLYYLTPPFQQDILSVGDYNGNGKKDFAILYQTNSIAPSFMLLIISFENHTPVILTAKAFLVQSSLSQSLKFADIDNDGKDELILNIFPYAYILKYDMSGDKIIFYSDGVNEMRHIFADDLNGNGVIDIALQFDDSFKFFEFGPAIRPEIPIILSAYSNASLHAELNWVEKTNQYFIYRGTNPDSLGAEPYDTVNTNSYVDINVEEFKTYYYAIQAYDVTKPEPLSKLSTPVEVYIHRPAVVDSVYASSQKNIIVKFSEKIKNTIENLQTFELLNLNDGFPNSISPASQYSYLLSFKNDLPIGINQLAISGLKDLYDSPIETDTVSFEVSPVSNPPQFYIASFEIQNAYGIKIVFNYDVDEATATDLQNYHFTPENKVTAATVDASDKRIIYLNLKGNKPVGSIGKEYVLQLKNIKSSPQYGSLNINEGAGSYIVLSTFAKDLSDIFVYPNPASISTGSGTATFANLPQRVKISIWTLNGKRVRDLEENNGDGGVTFDLKDENGEFLPSGIYIYRAVMLDEQNNEGQEKLGKFAVVR